MCARTSMTRKMAVVAWVLGCGLVSHAGPFAGGTGTPDDPYQVATAAQLRAIGYDPNHPNQCFVLVNDIDLDPNLPGGQVFHWPVVVLDASAAFNGVLDGAGHRIVNMTIEALGMGSSYMGLFPRIGPAGQVRNLGLVNARVSAGQAAWRVGAVAGENQGSISNCYATGMVVGGNGVGGLVGVNRGTLLHCQASCDVTATGNAGGLVGESDHGIIQYCGAEGTVTGAGPNSAALGGLAGALTYGEISLSYAGGAVTGVRNLGGLVGTLNGGRVTRCYATGAVQGEMGVGGLAGGVLGLWPDITWCYATGSVQATGAGRNAGGLMGFGSTGLPSCYFLSPLDGGGPDNGSGTPLTRAQMQQQANFASWDFYGSDADGLEDDWFMPQAGPPVLSWQEEITGLVFVPAVAGLSRATAEAALQDAGFAAGAVRSDYDEKVAVGVIISAYPQRYALPGAAIDLLESLGAYDWSANPGVGAPENPYQIAQASQLESLSNHAELWDRSFVLTADIDMAGRAHASALVAPDTNDRSPLYEGIPFTGRFDGQGFALRNLKLGPGSRDRLGLFGKVAPPGEVRRIRLDGVEMASGSSSFVTVGALAGENEGLIEDCSAEVTTGGWINIGGLVGLNKGEIHRCFIAGGRFGGSFRGRTNSSASMGGLVGCNEGGTIADCYVDASVMVEGGAGLVGRMAGGTIRSCYAAATIRGSEARHLGGLLGDNDEGEVIHCMWDMQAAGPFGSAGGMGLTTAEMKNAQVYARNGWSGNPAWVIDDGKDYPRLAWEGKAGQAIPAPSLSELAGSGTAADPYQVGTAQQLVFVGTASILWDKHFVVTTNIDLAGANLRPVGVCPGMEFRGTFDGNNHSLANLNMGGGAKHACYVGLFGYAGAEAVLQNLHLTTAAISVGEYSERVGVLAGLSRGAIRDCRVQATLTTTTGQPSWYVGAIAGENGGLVLRCQADCTFDSKAVWQVGGLVGKNTGGAIFGSRAAGSITCASGSNRIGGAVGENTGIMAACRADVAVVCLSNADSLGGLVGSNSGGNVVSCYATGVVTSGAKSKYIGGLVGDSGVDQTVANSYASGAVTAGAGSTDVGGFVGRLEPAARTGGYFLTSGPGDGRDNGIGVPLTDGQMREQGSFAGWDFVGRVEDGTGDFWCMPDDGGYPVLSLFEGHAPPVPPGRGTSEDPYLVGSAGQLGAVTYYPDGCYRLTADIDLTGITWTAAVVPVFRGRFEGDGHAIRHLSASRGVYLGLFGTLFRQATVTRLAVPDVNVGGSRIAGLAVRNSGTVSSCYATGQLTGGDLVGGLVGTNAGTIVDCYAACRVTAADRAGVLVGRNWGSILTSYACGSVSGPDDRWSIGPFVGYTDGGVATNCFWDAQQAGAIGSDAGRGLTTAEMMNAAMYARNGWAGDPNWVLDNGRDYPRLSWENKPGQRIAPVTVDWFAGQGTPEDPYRIETLDHLRLLGEVSILWDRHFVLTADVDAGGRSLSPIGLCPGTGFGGSFDGAGHHVMNLALGRGVARQHNLGLFGYIDPSGEVRDLRLDGIDVICGLSSGPAGTLAGTSYGSITRCSATGKVVVGDLCWRIGGLVGDNVGALESCGADVAVGVGNESLQAGGLAGNNYGVITDCYARGAVQGGAKSGRLGGLAGNNNGPLTHCYAAGDVVRTGAANVIYGEIGGLVAEGFVNSVVTSCYFLGPANKHGTKLSPEQMKQQSSFAGWDFETIWTICEGQGYPRLKWEAAPCGPGQ